jgi:hypothetical protein
MTAFLEMKDIMYDLSLLYSHESNGAPEYMNHTIVMIVRSMSLDGDDVITQPLWAEASSTAIHIKNHLPHPTFILKYRYTKSCLVISIQLNIYIPFEQNVICMFLKINRSG